MPSRRLPAQRGKFTFGFMDNPEAKSILSRELAAFAARPYERLTALIDSPQTIEVSANSGVTYQIEFNVFWDQETGGNLRIMGSIDDGGWRAWLPLSDSLLMRPDGVLV